MAMSVTSSISEEHGRECDKIIDDYINNTCNKNPGNLFHYTSLEAFYKIIESCEVWASDARYLNDPSEIIHGVQLAKALLKKEALLRNAEFNKFLGKFLEVDLESVAQSAAQYFVVSFSRKMDDLNQWRAYANNGKGVSLEFSEPEMDSIILATKNDWESNNIQVKPSSFEISYQRKVYDSIVNDMLNITESKFSNKFHSPEENGQVAKNIARSILLLSLYFKNDAYKEEEEFRFLLTCGAEYKKSIKYRVSADRIIPYINIKWKRPNICPLKRIWIGPAAPSTTTRELVKDFLHHHGFDDGIEVIRSEIPYRAL